MDQAIAAIIGAIVGGAASFMGSWLTGLRQEKTEKNKLSLEVNKLNYAQTTELNSEMREVIQTCIAKMASATHSMCWLTWLAEVSPKRITEERITLYDNELHTLLPEIIGLQARISTYNLDIGKKFDNVLADIEDLDARIGESAVRLLDNDDSEIDLLKKYHKEGGNLLDKKIKKLCYDNLMENLLPKAKLSSQEKANLL